MLTENELQDAHKHSCKNRDEIMRSKTAGCFYCLQTLKTAEICLWIANGLTATCPHCFVDSVIGDASNHCTPEFLEEMNTRFFGFHRKGIPEQLILNECRWFE